MMGEPNHKAPCPCGSDLTFAECHLIVCGCGSKKKFAECHADRPDLEGWAQIADALGVSQATAIGYAKRSFLPLVVYFRASNTVWCPWSSIRDFANLHHLPMHAYSALRENGLLPHQRSDANPAEVSPPYRVKRERLARRRAAKLYG